MRWTPFFIPELSPRVNPRVKPPAQGWGSQTPGPGLEPISTQTWVILLYNFSVFSNVLWLTYYFYILKYL